MNTLRLFVNNKYQHLNFEKPSKPKILNNDLLNAEPKNLKYLVSGAELELKHVPNMGAWTYHIEIPDSKDIVGRWGFLKASGTIDGYKVENKNLFTIAGQNKRISINEKIRKAINKTGGDAVIVTLYLTQVPATDKG